MISGGGYLVPRIVPGQRRGVWLVMDRIPTSSQYVKRWRCRCPHDREFEVRGSVLRSQSAFVPCGCTSSVVEVTRRDAIELLKAARNVLPKMSATRLLIDQFLERPDVAAILPE